MNGRCDAMKGGHTNQSAPPAGALMVSRVDLRERASTTVHRSVLP